MSCMAILEKAFVRCRSDHDTQLQQLDEAFHCAFSAAAGFLTSTQPPSVCNCSFDILFEDVRNLCLSCTNALVKN